MVAGAFYYFFMKKKTKTYVVGAHYKRLVRALLMSTKHATTAM